MIIIHHPLFSRTISHDLGGMLESLQDEGIKVAICTSDSREGTEAFLENTSISHLVDRVVCGDDPDSRPKPDPHNALRICSSLGVSPGAAIMVGDTPADTLMGQQAGLGLTVGVLSGVGGVEDLADADVIARDVQVIKFCFKVENRSRVGVLGVAVIRHSISFLSALLY